MRFDFGRRFVDKIAEEARRAAEEARRVAEAAKREAEEAAKKAAEAAKKAEEAAKKAAEETRRVAEAAKKEAEEAAKKAEEETRRTAEKAGETVVGIGEDAANAISKGAQATLDETKKAGKLVGAFLTSPLATFSLPQGSGKAEIWTGVYVIYLTKSAIDDVAQEGNVAASIIGLVGTIVGASAGTLTPVAGVLATYLATEWVLITQLANERGVTLSGSYMPPSPIVVPLPG